MSVRISLLRYLGICHPQSTLGMRSGILKYLEDRYYRCHYSSKVCCHMDIFELRRKKKQTNKQDFLRLVKFYSFIFLQQPLH